jgi:hypothetical protein
MTIEEMVKALETYHGKTVNGYSFTVTPESLKRAAGKCGVDAVIKFFCDGVDNGVSSVLAETPKKIINFPKP